MRVGVEIGQPVPEHHKRHLESRHLWLVAAGALIIWSIWQADLIGRDLVNEGGWELVRRFLQAFFRPELSSEFLALTLDAALVTLAYAGCAIFFFIILASVGGLLASEVWWVAWFKTGRGGLLQGKTPWVAVRTLLAFPRAIHEAIWGLFFINIIGLDPLTAILAVTIPFSAIGAKVFSEILDETPHAPLNALLNAGVKPFPSVLYGLIPQALPNLISYTFYRFECGIRAAAVLGLIGAGGLGYQLLLSAQTLNYQEMWTLLFALIILSGLSDLWSSVVRNKISRSSNQDWLITTSLIGVVGLIIFSFWYLSPEFSRLFDARTVEQFNFITSESFPPTLGNVSFGYMLSLSMRTLAMSVLAMVFAGFFGMIFSFIGARNFALPKQNPWLGLPLLVGSRLTLLVGRAVPPPLWALLALFVFFPGVLPAAIALGLYNWGVLGRLMAESVENMDERPVKALHTQGVPGILSFLYGAFPVTLPSSIAYILYRWEVCIRATVIVGLVGAGGLGRLINERLSAFDYDGVFAALLFLVALTWGVDLVGAAARRSMRQPVQAKISF